MPNSKVKINNISDFVICYCKNNGITVTPLLLQKLLYYIQAWHLVFFDDDPLFPDEPEAWVNGPVYRKVYNRFKKQWNEVGTLSICDDNIVEKKIGDLLKTMNLSEDQKEFIFVVLQKYGTMPAEKLVYLTHAEDPWNLAREGYGPFDRCTNPITHESMRKYYSERIQKK